MAVQHLLVAKVIEKTGLLNEVFAELPFRYVVPLVEFF